TAPSIFYTEYVLKKKEIRLEKHLLEGTLIHYLLLDNLAFDEKFLVTPETLPSDNSMKVANSIFEIYSQKITEDPSNDKLELVDFEIEILEVLQEMNLHQALKDTKDGTGD